MIIIYEPQDKQDELRKQLPPYAWLYIHTEIDSDIREHHFKCPYVNEDDPTRAQHWQAGKVTEYAPLTIDEWLAYSLGLQTVKKAGMTA